MIGKNGWQTMTDFEEKLIEILEGAADTLEGISGALYWIIFMLFLLLVSSYVGHHI
jgi:hypothetical protein